MQRAGPSEWQSIQSRSVQDWPLQSGRQVQLRDLWVLLPNVQRKVVSRRFPSVTESTPVSYSWFVPPTAWRFPSALSPHPQPSVSEVERMPSLDSLPRATPSCPGFCVLCSVLQSLIPCPLTHPGHSLSDAPRSPAISCACLSWEVPLRLCPKPCFSQVMHRGPPRACTACRHRWALQDPGSI